MDNFDTEQGLVLGKRPFQADPTNVIQLAGQRKMQSCLLAENSINKLVLPPTCIPLKSTDKIILLFYSPLACIARDKIY